MSLSRVSSSSALARLTGALLVGLALLASPVTAFAQDAAAPAAQAAPADPNAIVATVGGEAITEADLAFAAEDLGQELANVPPADRKAFLVTVLIDMKVMANAARAEKMDESEVFKRRIGYLEERALRRAYFAEKISAAVTPDSLKTAYDDYVKTFVPQEEVHARHILVASEEDAKAIKKDLDAGASFEELAKTKSIDPSAAQNGGDLGFFTKGMMVPEFEAVAFTLENGKISDPVKSQFGWHVIKVEEKRQSKPPTIDQIGQQLQQQILFKNFDETVARLKTGLAIDIPDPALKAAVQTQQDKPQ